MSASPQFDRPPVNETVLGLEFRPLNNWQVTHFGLFWDRIRGDYPRYTAQPPLPETPRPDMQISFGFLPSLRCWFIGDDDRWLIQVQNSRFISNWRRRGENEYPSYTKFRTRFEERYRNFLEFLATEKIGEPSVFEAEVSYINLIDIHSDLTQLPNVFPIFSDLSHKGFLPAPQAGVVKFVYLMPDNRGRLEMNLQPVLIHDQGTELLQLTVTAKTGLASNTIEGALDALDYGHDWVVRGFTDFTSPEMHKVWGRTV